MLPAKHRLRSTRDIQAVFKNGVCVNGHYLRLCALKTPSSTRIACVVGKTVSSSSVTRHRYQRWMREAARQALASLPQKAYYDIVVIGRSSLKTVPSYSLLEQDALPLFRSLVK